MRFHLLAASHLCLGPFPPTEGACPEVSQKYWNKSDCVYGNMPQLIFTRYVKHTIALRRWNAMCSYRHLRCNCFAETMRQKARRKPMLNCFDHLTT